PAPSLAKKPAARHRKRRPGNRQAGRRRRQDGSGGRAASRQASPERPSPVRRGPGLWGGAEDGDYCGLPALSSVGGGCRHSLALHVWRRTLTVSGSVSPAARLTVALIVTWPS